MDKQTSPLAEDQIFQEQGKAETIAMASYSLLSLNFITVPTSNLPKDPIFSRTHVHSSPLRLKTRENSLALPLPRVASTPAIPFPPINVDYLEEEFCGHGVTFEGIGDSCVAKLSHDNGSTATLVLPSGLVTSYKAPMWHGEKVEILQTFVSEGEDGEPLIQGGLSLEFVLEGEDGVSWSPSDWALSDIRGNSQETIQVPHCLFTLSISNMFIFLLASEFCAYDRCVRHEQF